ncbi:unnamed protein product [Prorocentrum cordatum]|uniref:Non-specific serine/threonine protein kinase n=1 Tax=Prorocentrum cordatum TaxID=2364126 RepID=A0ABN9S2T8_9DINO|nr:unnamed protein product [Polarella glacialis]
MWASQAADRLPPTPKFRIIFLWRHPPVLVLAPISKPPAAGRKVTVGASCSVAGDGRGASSGSNCDGRGRGAPASSYHLKSRGRSFSSVSNLGDRSRLECRAGKIAVSGRYHEQTVRIEDDYDIHDAVCGVGHGGQVHVATRRGLPRGRQRYAIKAFDIANASENSRKRWAEEVEVFLYMDHPHIARLYDVYDHGDKLYLAMELMEGGELFDRVVKQRALAELEAVDSTTQILWGSAVLHSHNVVHRDLKLENIVFDKQGSSILKLIDFGFSRIWEPGVNMDAELGTPGYMAPEVLSGSYTSQCDLWSVGVIVFTMLSGYAPFPGTRAEQKTNVKLGRFHMCPKRWAKVSRDAQEFTKSLLVVDPSRRLSAQSAMDHPWISRKREKMKLDSSVVKALREFVQASKFRRCCLEMIAWTLSSEERAKVLRYFRMMDQNKQGTITLTELQTALKHKFKVDDAEIQQIFNTMDTNNDREIHYSDFLAAMVSTHIDVGDHHLRVAFTKFDADCSGYITADNLREVLGDTFEGEMPGALLSEADLLHDGRVSYPEFAAFLRGDPLEGADDGLVLQRFDQAGGWSPLGRRRPRRAWPRPSFSCAWASPLAAKAPGLSPAQSPTKPRERAALTLLWLLPQQPRNGVSVTSVISARPLDLFKRHPDRFLIVGAGNVTTKKLEGTPEVQRLLGKPSSKAQRIVKAAEEARLPVPDTITEDHVAEEFRRLILADGTDSVYISSLCGRFLQRFKKPVTAIITCKPAEFLRRYPDIFVMTGGGNVGLREVLGPDAVSVPPPPPRVPKSLRDEQLLSGEALEQVELTHQVYSDIAAQIMQRARLEATVQMLQGVCRQVEQASFLALEEVVLGGAAGKGLPSAGSHAEIVIFVRQLPYKNFTQWLPHILETLVPVFESQLSGERAGKLKVERDHLQCLLPGGPELPGDVSVQIYISPVFKGREHLLECIRAAPPTERPFFYPALAKERNELVGNQSEQVKTLIWLMTWWSLKQNWTSALAGPSDWLVELAVVHACRQPGGVAGFDLAERVARVLEVFMNFESVKVLWAETGLALYESQRRIWRPLLSHQPLFMDPLNPYPRSPARDLGRSSWPRRSGLAATTPSSGRPRTSRRLLQTRTTRTTGLTGERWQRRR